MHRNIIVSWASQLSEHLISFTHAQWIFRCGLVHEASNNDLLQAEAKEVRRNIRRECLKGLHRLDEEDRDLLEEDLGEILKFSGVAQRVWLRTVQVARGKVPGRNVVRPRIWRDVMEDRRYDDRKQEEDVQHVVD